MNTLHDLRDTLEWHAHDVHDDPGVARVAAVEGRARAVRRRRAAGAGAAVVLAVAAVATVTVLPGDREPAPSDRELIGREAPATLKSLGYTYRFVEGVESEEDRPARLRLRSSDRPRLVTWASEADEVVVDVSVSGYGRWSGATDFEDFIVVPGVESARLRIRAGGAESALAVYELDPDELPPGTSDGGLTFREQVGSERLIDVAVAEPGATEVSLEVTVPASERLRIAEFCQGVPSGGRLWVNTSVDGDGATASDGCDDEDFDPADGSASWLEDRHLPEPGNTARIRMWVSRGFRGAPVEVDGARLALAAYDQGEPAAVVAGWEMPQLYEHEGQVWGFVGTRVAARGQGELEVRNETDDVLLAVGSYAATGRGWVEFRAGPEEGVSRSSAGGSGSDMRALLAPGSQPARIRVRGEVSARTELGFALYERVD